MEALLCGCIPVIHRWDDRFTPSDFERGEITEVYEINVEGNFSTKNIRAKMQSARQKIIKYQQDWPKNVKAIVEDVNLFFS